MWPAATGLTAIVRMAEIAADAAVAPVAADAIVDAAGAVDVRVAAGAIVDVAGLAGVGTRNFVAGLGGPRRESGPFRCPVF